MSQPLKAIFLNKIEKVIFRLSGAQTSWRRFYIQQKDDALGRERVGLDKYGNKYYQYYSYHGLPTKRIALYKFHSGSQFHQDPHFLGWLRRNEILPPTPDELERLYLEHDAFVARGIEWDNEQQAIINEFKTKKAELDKQYERQELGEGPKSWVPGTKAEVPANERFNDEIEDFASKDENTLMILSEIDELEQTYLHEYDKVFQKDADGNKDLNKLAIHDLKKAHYFFAYMRTSEKLYNAELRRKAKVAKDLEEPPTELEIIQ